MDYGGWPSLIHVHLRAWDARYILVFECALHSTPAQTEAVCTLLHAALAVGAEAAALDLLRAEPADGEAAAGDSSTADGAAAALTSLGAAAMEWLHARQVGLIRHTDAHAGGTTACVSSLSCSREGTTDMSLPWGCWIARARTGTATTCGGQQRESLPRRSRHSWATSGASPAALRQQSRLKGRRQVRSLATGGKPLGLVTLPTSKPSLEGHHNQ